MFLLKNVTADGSSTPQQHLGGLISTYCWGTFNTATVKLQSSPDNVEWFDIPETTFTEKTQPINIELTPCWLRGNVSSAGGATDVNLFAKK